MRSIQFKNIGKNWLVWALLLSAAEGGYFVGYLISIPGDEASAVLLGLSLQRLFLVAVLAFAMIVSLVLLAVLIWYQPGQHKVMAWFEHPRVEFVFLLLSLVTLLALMTPAWFGRAGAYFERLQPIFAWVGLAGLQVSVFRRLKGIGERWQIEISAFRKNGLLRSVLFTTGIFAELWAVIRITEIGLNPDPLYWNEASVPVMTIQIWISFLLTVCASGWLLPWLKKSKRTWWEYAIPLFLWAFAFFLWNATPMLASYFAPGPYPPGNMYYPYSDAALYDVAGQYVTFGRGLANGGYIDKPLYSLFLGFLHLLVGQSYNAVIAVQIAVLAALPVGIYFLVKNMSSLPAGLFAGLLAIFQQRNAIAATREIQVSHSKLLMTEYPTACILVLATLAAFLWLKSPLPRRSKAVIAGVLFAAAALIRPNALIPFAVVALLAFLHKFRGLRKGIVSLLIFGGSALLILLPWLTAIPTGYTEPVLFTKIKAIISTRYITPAQEKVPEAVPTETPVAMAFGAPAAAISPLSNLPFGLDENSPVVFVARHFVHNEIMALMMFPLEGRFPTLAETLQTPYWQTPDEWMGDLSVSAALIFFLNLFILAAGLGYAWQRWQWAGLVPLAVQIGYFLANGVARNSGARYLVAADWVELVYYAIGLISLAGFALRLFKVKIPLVEPDFKERLIAVDSRRNWAMAAVIFSAAILASLMIPLAGKLLPDKIEALPADAVMQKLLDYPQLQLTQENARKFLAQEGARAWQGAAIYPRYYEGGQGEPLAYYNGMPLATPLQVREYSRFSFTLLTSEREYSIVMPSEWVTEFPDGAQTAVYGCWNPKDYYLDAYAVVVFSDPPVVLQRNIPPAVDCPALP